MATNSYSRLQNSNSAWNNAIRKFGILTVMNAKVYDVFDGETMKDLKVRIKGQSGNLSQDQLAILYKISTDFVTRTEVTPTTDPATYTYTLNDTAKIDFSKLKVNEIIALYLMTNPIATLKYLKTANSTQEGPTKTITGGQNASPLIKYGKTARLEMQDALGNAEALEALTGLTVEYFRTTVVTDGDYTDSKATDVLHATTTFAGHKTIIGDTFIIDANTGKQVPAYVIFYDFLSDSLFNLTQDAEGDATVFDMNGDLIETKIYIGDDENEGNTNGVVTGTFYTILPQLNYNENPQAIEAGQQTSSQSSAQD